MTTLPEAKTPTAAYHLKAVIDVGSTSIRMVVAQVHDDGTFVSLDSLRQSVAIGSDTFTQGRISTDTIEDCVKVLRNFSTVLSEYKIDLQHDVRAVATSAVREARNRDDFLDRLYVATHINVDVIEGSEINRLTFQAVRPLLERNKSLQHERLLVAEVGGGNTEFLGLDDGAVSFAHTCRMGSYRLREDMDALHASDARQIELLDMEIGTGVSLMQEMAKGEKKGLKLLLMGGEARFAAKLLLGEWDETTLAQLKVTDLVKLARRVLHTDVEQIVKQYNFALEEAQTLGPALQIYSRMAKAFGVKHVFVCGVTLRDGLLAEAAGGHAWTEDFVDQILNSIREISRRYDVDEAHADCVTANALALFRALADDHQLGYRYEVILTVAAQLHDIGAFISVSSHHKHSKYLIENSDIFGMNEEDVKLTALVARYHRRALPRVTHTDYGMLPREKRLIVSKLAAILRVADALDRSHTQGISKIRVRTKEDHIVIEVDRSGEFATEKRALVAKGVLFQQVYGRMIVLRARKKQG